MYKTRQKQLCSGQQHVFCLCFFGFLRMGEAVVPSDSGYDPTVHLNIQDVRVNSMSDPRWLEVQIKASKTDLMQVGVTIYLGSTGRWLCLVASLLAYMVQRGSGTGPMFHFSDGRFLTRAGFASALRSACTRQVWTPANIQATVLQLVQQPPWQRAACRTPSSRH